MKIGILGAGWVGEKLGISLLKEGHSVYTTNTSVEKSANMKALGFTAFTVDFFIDFSDEIANQFSNLDIVIISIALRRSLSVEETQQIFKNCIRFLKNGKNQQLVFFSSVGVYPIFNEQIDESFKEDLLVPRIRNAEKLLQDSFPDISILRLGGIFGEDRIFAKYFANRVLKGGNLPVNHIHYLDIIGVVKWIIEKQLHSEVLNVVAPIKTSKEAVINEQVQSYNIVKPTAIEIDTASFKEVIPARLEDLEYQFIKPNPIYF